MRGGTCAEDEEDAPGDGSTWARLPSARKLQARPQVGGWCAQSRIVGQMHSVWGAPSRTRQGKLSLRPGVAGLTEGLDVTETPAGLAHARVHHPPEGSGFHWGSVPPTGRHGLPNLFAEKTLGK